MEIWRHILGIISCIVGSFWGVFISIPQLLLGMPLGIHDITVAGLTGGLIAVAVFAKFGGFKKDCFFS